MSNSIIEVALQFCNERKWCPIPVGEDKQPLGKWKQFQKQLPTDAEIKRAFSRTPPPNVGVVCGAVSKLVVLDIDGEEGFRSLQDKGLQIPETLSVKTGRGRHYYFLHPGVPTRNFAKGRSSFPLPGVDFRGDGGYVVAPPSLHATGVRYVFENDHQPAALPAWLYGMVVSVKADSTQETAGRPSRPAQRESGRTVSRPERILADALKQAREGSRNETGLWLACQLRDNDLSEPEARSYIQRYVAAVPQGSSPYTEQEALATLRSAYSQPAREPWGRPVSTGPSGPTGPRPLPEQAEPLDRSENGTGPGWANRATPATGAEKLDFPPVSGYRITSTGVSWIPDNPDKPDVLITHKPCGVVAHCRDGAKQHWGALLRWFDRDDVKHELAVPAGRFHEQGGALPAELANAGLPIVPGKERKLLEYFGNCHPVIRHRAATMLGWQDGLSAFVLPKETLGETASRERVVYQPDQYSPTLATVYPRGALEGWQQHIAAVCQGNPVLAFGVSAAFAAPLFDVVGLEGGGVHLFGVTSHGKTTCLQVAASVWGDGSDPAEGRLSAYVKKWNLTKNATEGLAEAHNDLPLCLDEVGEADAQDFGRMIYQLAGGVGKQRMRESATLKPPKVWRTLVLSTGELPAAEAVEQAGRVVRGGQLARMIDLPANHPQTGAGIVLELHGAESPGAFVDRLKRACREQFGWAGPAFVRKILAEGRDQLRARLKPRLEEMVIALTPSGAAADVVRVVKRLALIALAGELAQEWGFVPWESRVPREAAQEMVERFVQNRGGSGGQAEQAIKTVQAFMLAHSRSRFANKKHVEHLTLNLAGYRDEREKFLYFTSEGFREACAGHAPRDVARHLKERGFLDTPEDGRLTQRIEVTGLGERIRVYAVSTKLLDDAI